jgi:hypothetical protein
MCPKKSLQVQINEPLPQEPERVLKMKDLGSRRPFSCALL